MDNLERVSPANMVTSMIGSIIIVFLIGFGCLKGCEYITIKSICDSNPDICLEVVSEFKGN